jgi:hypothetical protein
VTIYIPTQAMWISWCCAAAGVCSEPGCLAGLDVARLRETAQFSAGLLNETGEIPRVRLFSAFVLYYPSTVSCPRGHGLSAQTTTCDGVLDRHFL